MTSSILPEHNVITAPIGRGYTDPAASLPPVASPARSSTKASPDRGYAAPGEDSAGTDAVAPRASADAATAICEPATRLPLQTGQMGRAQTTDERATIAQRIAAFRNLQIRLKQEREAYCDQTLARARALLTAQAKPPQ